MLCAVVPEENRTDKLSIASVRIITLHLQAYAMRKINPKPTLSPEILQKFTFIMPCSYFLPGNTDFSDLLRC